MAQFHFRFIPHCSNENNDCCTNGLAIEQSYGGNMGNWTQSAMITIYILINTNDLAVAETIVVKKLQTFQIIRLRKDGFFLFLFFQPSTICSCLFSRFYRKMCLVPFFLVLFDKKNYMEKSATSDRAGNWTRPKKEQQTNKQTDFI